MIDLLPRYITSRFDRSKHHDRDWTADSSSGGLLSPVANARLRQGHRRQLSVSRLRSRKTQFSITVFVLLLIAFLYYPTSVDQGRDRKGSHDGIEDDSVIPLGQSRSRGGREVFWWEQFPLLNGFYRGRKQIVPYLQYVPEQRIGQPGLDMADAKSAPALEKLPSPLRANFHPCYLDDDDKILPPMISAYQGIPQGLPSPLFGSQEELGFHSGVCYDRVNRLGPYGYGTSKADGGLGIKSEGDEEGIEQLRSTNWQKVNWHSAQQRCTKKNAEQIPSRTAFVIRTWSTFEYSKFDILMLRAIISELAIASGGQYTVHFLIHVQDDSLPIWASRGVYDRVLRESLPEEFHGMGTLWSVAQMKLIYPPPFPESIVNFSGGDVYEAYRSLHFPFQHFASEHPEYDFFWHWEMDIRITGHYDDLLHRISEWADKQPTEYAWERSAKFFIPSIHNGSYGEFAASIIQEAKTMGHSPVTGPQLDREQLLKIPEQSQPIKSNDITDLIAFNPLFDPSHTRWAFHDDITGYHVGAKGGNRPPTRASLITASRLSRRLLLLMHEETYRNKHTMFPEMYPASIALQYGLRAVTAPLPVYFDRDWPGSHADQIFNNAPIDGEGRSAGMDHGEGYFHGPGGSVFGPGEHVFRGGSYYSNAMFAGYLWRRWLGRENNHDEISSELGIGGGRMCLPMMVLHPIKHE